MIQINDFSFLTYVCTFTTSSIPYSSPLLFIFNNCRKYDLSTTTIGADMDGVKKYKWKEASIIIIHPTTSTIDHHGLDLITYKYAFRNRKLCFFFSIPKRDIIFRMKLDCTVSYPRYAIHMKRQIIQA